LEAKAREYTGANHVGDYHGRDRRESELCPGHQEFALIRIIIAPLLR